MAKKKRLEDSEWLFTMLTALVKQNGGEIRVKDEDLVSVSKKDIVGLFYDKKDQCTILKLVNPSDMFGTPSVILADKDYEN